MEERNDVLFLIHLQNLLNAMVDPIYQIIPFLEYLPLPRNIRLKESADHMLALLRGAVEERMKEREAERAKGVTLEERPPRDLLDLLIPLSKGVGSDFHLIIGLILINEHFTEEEGLPMEELIPNMWVFFIAGHDTTGSCASP